MECKKKSFKNIATVTNRGMFAENLQFGHNMSYAIKGTCCLGSVELVFEKWVFITVCYKMHMIRKMF